MKLFHASIFIFLITGLTQADAQIAVFSDADFTGWGITLYAGANASASSLTQQTGGNPDAFFYTTTEADIPDGFSQPWWVVTLHDHDNAHYDPSQQGKIGSINYAEDAIEFSRPHGGVQTGLLLTQNGIYYLLDRRLFANQSTWTHQTLTGLNANDFLALDSSKPLGLNPNFHPDFSNTGSIISFGMFRRLSSDTGGNGFTVAAGVDNWSVALYAVPEPASLVLAVLSFIGIVAVGWGRYHT